MYDIVIIGQGIAGSILAHYLDQAKINFMVIDHLENNSASRVAAGLINPLSMKRLTPVSKANNIFKTLFSFYQNLEQELHAKFLYPLPILKYLDNEYLQNDWMHKADIYPDFFSDEKMTGFEQYGKVKCSGYIDTLMFLNTFRNHLEKQKRVISQKINYEKIAIHQDHITIELENASISCRKIVFCEGHHISKNPFFKHINLTPTKGEILTVETEKNIDLHYILSQSGFIVPIAQNRFVVGSTYERNYLDSKPSILGSKAISDIFEHCFPNIRYKIIEHKAGIRPNTRDRNPIFEIHQKYPNMMVINGLGSRGLSIAPTFIEGLLGKILA